MSQHANLGGAYRRAQIQTASQGRIIVMLHDEALRQMGRAEQALQHAPKRLEESHHALTKSHQIITELMASLNLEEGGDVATQLSSLYNYFCSQLVAINLSKEPQQLSPMMSLLQQLREAWKKIESKADAVEPAPQGGFSLSG